MIRTSRINNTIRIDCTNRRVVNLTDLKKMYRNGERLINQHENFPVIVTLGKNVRMDYQTSRLFFFIIERLENVTLVIITE